MPPATAPDRDQRLIALVCHDLRTPLNAVIGFSDVMRHELFGPLGHERYRAYSDHIRTSGEQLLKATEDLLALTRIASTSMEVRDAVSPADQVVERMRANLAPEHWDRVRLARSDEAEGLSLCCDHNLLAQALLNAASQMLALSPQAAVVEVHLRRTGAGACFVLACGEEEAGGDTDAPDGGIVPDRHAGPQHQAPPRVKPLGFAAASMTTALIGGTFHIVGLPGSRLRAEIRLPASTIVAPAREQAAAAGGERAAPGGAPIAA